MTHARHLLSRTSSRSRLTLYHISLSVFDCFFLPSRAFWRFQISRIKNKKVSHINHTKEMFFETKNETFVATNFVWFHEFLVKTSSEQAGGPACGSLENSLFPTRWTHSEFYSTLWFLHPQMKMLKPISVLPNRPISLIKIVMRPLVNYPGPVVERIYFYFPFRLIQINLLSTIPVSITGDRKSETKQKMANFKL